MSSPKIRVQIIINLHYFFVHRIWGFEAHNIVPDIVIIGKPMANGHPMGAVICTNEIAESFSKGVEFFSSFGGNPVSCAIATSVLEVIEEEKLQENAKNVGNYYKSLFLELQKNIIALVMLETQVYF